jgi:hypothetical protein
VANQLGLETAGQLRIHPLSEIHEFASFGSVLQPEFTRRGNYIGERGRPSGVARKSGE